MPGVVSGMKLIATAGALAVAVVALCVPPGAAQGRVPELVRPPGLTNPATAFVEPSADGRVLIFRPSQAVVPEDTDASEDVYAFDGTRLELMSDGPSAVDPAAKALAADVSRDGSRVFIVTAEPLTSADTDTARDIYVRADGTTTLVSDGAGGADPDEDAQFHRASADGSRVVFSTREPLVAADGDSAFDLYENVDGQVRLISDRVRSGPDGNQAVSFLDMSDDGRRVFFDTLEQIVDADGDPSPDVYASIDADGGRSTALLSDRIQPGVDQAESAVFQDATPDGFTVLFATDERILPGDGDAERDVYLRRGGITQLMSDRENAGADKNLESGDAHISDDGRLVAFVSDEDLLPADTDPDAGDVYTTDGATLSLASDRLTPGPDPDLAASIEGLAADGGVFVGTDEPLLAADLDLSSDFYEFRGDALRIVSDSLRSEADTEVPPVFKAVVGNRLIFEAKEPLVAADGDATGRDVYEVVDGVPVLASDRARTGEDEAVDATFRRATGDGGKLFIATAEPLADGDGDTATDLYAMAVPPPPAAPPSAPPAAGGTPPPPGTTVPDGTAPRLRSLSLRPSRLVLGKTATVRFTSSEAARATLVFERVTCKKKSRRARRCTNAFKRVGKPLRVEAVAGANRVRFKPARGFKPGAHRLRLAAVDAAGNKAREQRENFTLLKAKKR